MSQGHLQDSGWYKVPFQSVACQYQNFHTHPKSLSCKTYRPSVNGFFKRRVFILSGGLTMIRSTVNQDLSILLGAIFWRSRSGVESVRVTQVKLMFLRAWVSGNSGNRTRKSIASGFSQASDCQARSQRGRATGVSVWSCYWAIVPGRVWSHVCKAFGLATNRNQSNRKLTVWDLTVFDTVQIKLIRASSKLLK